MNIKIDWTKLGIEFAIQAVFLTIILVVMLKQQKLAWKLPGLLGTVILACLFVQIPYAGIVIAFIVALLCITKVIGARTFTDAIFAVGVAFVLFGVFNYAAVPPLAGVLTPLATKVRARMADPNSAAPTVSTNQSAGSNAVSATAASASPTSAALAFSRPNAGITNLPAASPAPTPGASDNANFSPAPNASPAPAPTPAAASPAPSAVAARPAEPVFDTNRLNAVRLAADIMKHFYVKGVSQGATISIAMLSNGTRNFDIVSGDTIQLQTSDGRYAAVKCLSIGDGQVIVDVEGVTITLFRR